MHISVRVTSILGVSILAVSSAGPAGAQIYTPQLRIQGRTYYEDKPDPKKGQFSSVIAIALDRKGDLYIAGPTAISRFSAQGKFVGLIGSPGNGNGQFDQRYGPGGVAVGPDGSVYASNPGSGSIYRFDARGRFQYAFGSPGDGPGQFKLAGPGPLCTDRSGNVYVLDQQKCRVQKFDADGRFLLAFGNGGDRVLRYGRYVVGDGQFTMPKGITTDAAGNMYVADDERIQMFRGDGKFLGKITGTELERVAVGDDGLVYACGGTSGRVQIFNRQGKVVSKFGAPDKVGLIQTGILVTPKGDVYLAQSGNGMAVVKKFRRRYLAP